MILSEIPDEPYLAENKDDGAIDGKDRLRDLSLIRLLIIPAFDRQTDGRKYAGYRAMPTECWDCNNFRLTGRHDSHVYLRYIISG